MSNVWTQDLVDWLTKHYPLEGKVWCMQASGMTEAQIRAKAARLHLKARGVSAAWRKKTIEHGDKLRGRKRPLQAIVIRRLRAAGKLNITSEGRAAASVRAKKWIAEHGHPRGALGMRHSAEAKKRIGEMSRRAHARRSAEQNAERVMKMMKTRERNGTMAPPRIGASWKAGWREIGGARKFYRSKWEANYARYLEWLRANGNIQSWEHEPETFWFHGIRRGCCSYLPDFRVTENNGLVVYHEVKGWMDDRSKTKLRRMAKYHPKIKVVLILEKQYREIKGKLSPLIAGWEQ